MVAGDTNSSSSANPSLLPATSSRCLTHGITATHDYKVSNFSLLVGIGQVVASSTFSAGGCNWSIRFFPDGDDETPEEAASFTAVYLCLVAGPAGTRIRAGGALLWDSNDSFTIRCAMAVIRTHTEDDAIIEVPESVLRHDLARMLRDGDGTDVTFVVGDRFFRAHRSMVFKAQLFGAMKEAQA
ncbi:BTB/POZ and MATH domain-containing protein 2-like [Miscanthus floridulus]|uniref:BTB/POZ and MATH domain-containing protein 2-like n=1 Tax=Miscanthus floridulus TaxID=154761 RepID=UPI0034585FC1